jgi:hypothetical protein
LEYHNHRQPFFYVLLSPAFDGAGTCHIDWLISALVPVSIPLMESLKLKLLDLRRLKHVGGFDGAGKTFPSGGLGW